MFTTSAQRKAWHRLVMALSLGVLYLLLFQIIPVIAQTDSLPNIGHVCNNSSRSIWVTVTENNRFKSIELSANGGCTSWLSQDAEGIWGRQCANGRCWYQMMKVGFSDLTVSDPSPNPSISPNGELVIEHTIISLGAGLHWFERCDIDVITCWWHGLCTPAQADNDPPTISQLGYPLVFYDGDAQSPWFAPTNPSFNCLSPLTPTPTPTRTPTPVGGARHTPTPTQGAGGVTIMNAWPQGTNVNPGQRFNPDVTIQTTGFSLNCSQDYLENRDGNLYNTWPTQGCVALGNNQYRIHFNMAMQAPTNSGDYHSSWQVWHYPNHVGPQIDIWFHVLGPNHAPPTPVLLTPTDWSDIRSQTAPELCWNPVSDPDGDQVEYWAEVYQSAVNDSTNNWVTGTCWRPARLDGQYFGYQWHVKARDSRGAESGWSATWHFGLSPPPYNPPHPTTTPPALPILPVINSVWWDPAYSYRRPLTITTNSVLTTGMLMIADQFDLNTLVAQGKARPDFNDVRVVRRISNNSWQEVARRAWASTDLEFFLAASITQPVDTSYYIYYGNPTAGSPPSFTLTQGYWVSHYLDKWWTSFHSIWEHSDTINSNDVCGPPIDHRTHTGSSFDDSDVYDGRIFIPTTGQWTFREYTNDGWALYIDDALIGRDDGYISNNRWVTVGSTNLTAGWHRFFLPDMWVNCGGMVLNMAGPNFPDQVVPANYYQRWYGIMQTGLPTGAEQPFTNATLTPTPTNTSTPSATPTDTAIPTNTPIRYQMGVMSVDVPKHVPDNGQVTSTLVITNSELRSIADVNVVELTINHSWIQDLEVRLTSPSGTTVVLWDAICFNEPNIDLISLDDNAPQSIGMICPPFSWDAYRPQEALSVLNGEDANGTWTLTVLDHESPDDGMLTAWGLYIQGTPPVTPCPIQFVDVPNSSTFYDYIRCLACRGIVGGYPCGGPGEPCPGTYYRPGNNITRSQLSKIIANASGLADPILSSRQTFADVPSSNTFWVFIERLAGRETIGGYPCGGQNEPCDPQQRPYFRPGANATRGQIAKIVGSAAGWRETPDGQTFEDVAPGSTFYLFIERMASRGIIGGYPCGGPNEPCILPINRPYFRPNNNATRGQMSKIAANTFYPSCQTP